MAEKKGFDLASVLSDVSIPDTGREQIEYIDISRLISDGNNFYSLDGIEDLAANIETVGLQQPLRVRRSGADYIIVSGHRRAAAIRLLVKDGRSDLAAVPCIVEQGDVSPAMRELRLIYANADTRKMSAADISKQAERVEALLYQLKEEGYDFPGRMRDHVAEACKVSRTKLARLKVIRDKLRPDFLEVFEAGRLPESVAYAIAQKDLNYQEKLTKYRLGKESVASLSEFDVKSFYSYVEVLENRICKETEKNCGFVDGALAKYAKKPGYYCFCVDRCCADCYSLSNCSASCPEASEAKAKRLAERAELDAKRKADKEAQKLQEAVEELEWRKQWLRIGAAMEKAGITEKELLAIPGFEPWEDFRDYLTGQVDECDVSFFEEDDPVEMYVAVADLLHTSVDYILGRDGYDARDSLHWRGGEPTADGVYWAKFELDGSTFNHEAYFRTDTKRWSFPHGASIEAVCRAWYPLPEDKGG